MAIHLLSTFLRAADEQPLAALVQCPVLVWEAGTYRLEDDTELQGTLTGGMSYTPSTENPLLVLVQPPVSPPGEITLSLGRSGTCELPIPNPSVSRLHGLLHFEPRANRWMISDASSRNGTSVDGTELERETSTVLPSGARLRLGDVRLRFLWPAAFRQYLERRRETPAPMVTTREV